MRSIFIGLFAGMLWHAGSVHAEVQPIRYNLAPVFSGKSLTGLAVEMRFVADDHGEAVLDLPDHFSGRRQLYMAVKDLRIAGADWIGTPDPARRHVHARPNAPIVVSYRLDATLKAREVPPADGGVSPAIGPDMVHVLGQTLFASVAGRDHMPARFAWAGIRGWTFVASMEDPTADTDQYDVVNSVILAGKALKVTRIQTPYTALRVASLGHFDYALADFNVSVVRAIAAEQAFWGNGQPTFLVTLSPIADPAGQSFVGHGLSNAFDVVTTASLPEDTLKIYIAHEYFHSWDPPALGGPEPGGKSGYWFSEGLTDYYSRKLALRGHMIDLRAFVEAWNMALNRNAVSPVRAAPNARIVADFWNDPNVENLAYDRSAMLAAVWNARWHEDGGSLDRFMLTLRDMAKADPGLSQQDFVTRVTRAAGQLNLPLGDDLQNHVADGAPVILPADAFGGCLKVIDEDVANFDPGYDRDASAAAEVLRGVDPNGNAWRAGLRDDMTRLAVLGGAPGDSSVPLSFRVRDAAGSERTITWLPQGKDHYNRQHVVLPEDLTPAQMKSCEAAVAVF